MCRVCMFSSESLVDMFSNRPLPDSECSLAQTANDIVDFKIYTNDKLSKNICISCRIHLLVSLRLKLKFEKNQQLLESNLRKESSTPLHVQEDPCSTIKCLDDHETVSMAVNTHSSQRYLNRQCKRKISAKLDPSSSALNDSIDEMDQPDKENPLSSKSQAKKNRKEITSNSNESSDNSSSRDHVTEKRLYKCSQCPKAFTARSNLKAHTYTHTGERPYKCYQCPKGFTGRSNLKKHIYTHTGERPFKCSQCPKAFSDRSTLRVHTNTYTKMKKTI